MRLQEIMSTDDITVASAEAASAASPKRARRPDSPRRSPMAGSVPRPVKRTAGKAAAVADIPAYIRAVGVRIKSLPITAEKVLNALKERASG